MRVRSRKWSNGKQAWFMDYIMDGIRQRRKIPGALTRKEAQEIADRWFADRKRREFLGEMAGPTATQECLTLYDMLIRDRERVGGAESTRVSEKNQANVLCRILGNARKVSSISNALIETYKATRMDEGVAPRTCNIELQLLKAALNRAVRFKLIHKLPLRDYQGSRARKRA
jgi:hypothetical protein